MNKPNFYMIANEGTLRSCEYALKYPYHLVLAQFWDNHNYRTGILDIQNRGARIILDNGAHEGVVMKPYDYALVALELQPHVVVLPDLINTKSEESRSRQLDFAHDVERGLPGVHFMYCGQGRTKKEVIDDYTWAVSMLDHDKFIIGFGQAYLQWADPRGGLHKDRELTRAAMFVDLFAHFDYLELEGPKEARFHILGARWDPWAYGAYWQQYNFVGLDTVKPVQCALNAVVYPQRPETKIDHLSDQACSSVRLRHNVRQLVSHYNLAIPDDIALTQMETL